MTENRDILIDRNGYKDIECINPHLESLPGDASGSPVPVGGAAAVAHSDAINLPDGGHSHGGPEITERQIEILAKKILQNSPDVNVSGDGGASDVEPVLVVGGELLADVGLDEVDPLGDLHLAGLLEVSGEGHSKGLLGHVLHADRGHVCF